MQNRYRIMAYGLSLWAITAIAPLPTTGVALASDPPSTRVAPPEPPLHLNATALRSASKARAYTIRTEAAGKLPSIKEVKVIKPTADGCTLEEQEYTEGTKKAERPTPTKVETTWADWARAAASMVEGNPGVAVLSSTGEFKTPFGTFQATIYTIESTRPVRGSDAKGRQAPRVERIWFADEVPGVPLRHEVVVDGQAERVSTLIQHRPRPRPARKSR